MEVENTETVTITKEGNSYQITVQHDQSGSSYGMPLSESAYEQLYEYFKEESEKRLIQLEKHASANTPYSDFIRKNIKF